MKVVLFCQSFRSCWNHGNAHFQRGIARELKNLSHSVMVYEPENGWSRRNAILDGGRGILAQAESLVPGVALRDYDLATFDADKVLDGANLVIVHEWTDPQIVAAIGRARRSASLTLLFHDTHHRGVTAPWELDALALDDFDGVLAFGEALSHVYADCGWGKRVFTWHEAADVALFAPQFEANPEFDLVWIGNWGDDERTLELNSYLIEPIRQLRLDAVVHGVRYPPAALKTFLPQPSSRRAILFGRRPAAPQDEQSRTQLGRGISRHLQSRPPAGAGATSHRACKTPSGQALRRRRTAVPVRDRLAIERRQDRPRSSTRARGILRLAEIHPQPDARANAGDGLFAQRAPVRGCRLRSDNHQRPMVWTRKHP